MLTVLAISALALVRNQVVYRNHTRRIEEIHQRHTAAIDAGTFDPAMLDAYDFEVGDYTADLINLRKWTYAQFYPACATGEPSHG